ncbi:helix-turn-helix domain-containing protein [Baekduia soli]|uniref:Helix-turn-helix domain-containing protein n=1 Tax=Baekduia soli TaxID=496014 RepID=A0A5B8U9C0_9ACTN|nr:helix-turn-helix domain-containing protein [Baekduia soli]
MNSPRITLDEPLLTADQVGELLGIPGTTVLAFAREGRMPCRRFGRRVRFVRVEIEHWLSGTAA